MNTALHGGRARTHVSKFLLIFAITVATMTQQLAAQNPKRMHGTVHDPLGAVVTGAQVDLLDGDVVVAHAVSGADGSFLLDVPRSARYRVRAAAASFETTTIPAKRSLDITLATATFEQEITVTAAGTPLPEAQTGVSVTVLRAKDFNTMLEVQEPLRLVPGLQMTQTGQMGGTAGLSIRGGATDANKVLIDGVPTNAIGGGVEFANLATVGVDRIEVLREPNSALYGPDALAGVVHLTSTRGTTPLPLFTYAGDAGNFHTYRNEMTAGTAYRQLDLFSTFARVDTDNNIANSEFHNATFMANVGWAPAANQEMRFTVRHLAVSGGQPNAIALYGIADDGQQKEQDSFYSAMWNGQTTARWHNQIRYGGLRQKGDYNSFGATGIPDALNPGLYDGAFVTITGANGYTVKGQAQFQYSDTFSSFLSTTKRDFIYAQSDYRVSPHLLALGAFKYEDESGSSVSLGYTPNAVQRGNYSYTLQMSGDVKNRLFYTLGSGLEDNGLFGFAATPRASLAYYVLRPSAAHLFSGTKMHASFGKGIKEPSVYQQSNSLYGVLAGQTNGSQLLRQYNVSPLGAENSRTFDGGIDQELLNGRAKMNVTYFHNEFTNGVEYVPPSGLLSLGIAAANLAAFQYVGAYINSSAFRSQGVEFETEYELGSHVFARGGYTYTDAVVQHSFSSDNLGPSFNTAGNFSTVAIGAYSPLVGARPFRVAPHSGYFGLNYTRSKMYATLTATMVGKRDDSDFLCDNTQPYYGCGTSLLLPNRDLLGAYQRVELGGGYQVRPRVKVYANVENLLSEHYFEAFGFPALPLTFRTGVKFNFGGESWKLN